MSNTEDTFIKTANEVVNLITEDSIVGDTLKEKEAEKIAKENSFKQEENSKDDLSSEGSEDTQGDELNMGKIERTYADLTYEELQSMAYTLGLAGIHSKPEAKLRKEIIEAHTIQKLYAGRDDVETKEESIIEEMGAWRFAFELRSAGISNESLKILVENEIITKE